MITRTHLINFRVSPHATLKGITMVNDIVYAHDLNQALVYLISGNHKIVQVIPTRYNHYISSSELSDAVIITTTTE